MAINVAVATGQLDETATVPVPITSPGFGTVKAAIMIATETADVTEGQLDSNAIIGIGFIDDGGGFNQLAGGVTSQDNDSQTDARVSSSLRAVYLPAVSSGVFADWSAVRVTDGLEFTKESGTTFPCYVQVILLGGDDISNTEAVGKIIATSTNTSTVTGMGFEPDLYIGATVGTIGITADQDDGVFSIGVAGKHQGGSISQWCSAFYDDDAVTNAVVTAKHATGMVNSILNSVGASVRNIVVDSFDSDGMTFSHVGGGGELIYGLAIKFADPVIINIGNNTLAGSGSSWTSDAANGTPVFGFMTSTHGVHNTTTTETVGCAGFQMTSVIDGEYYTSAISIEDNASPTNAQTVRSKNPAWKMLQNDATAMTGSVSFNGSNQMALSITGMDANDMSMLYFILSDATSTIPAYEGSNGIDAIYSGSNSVTGIYKGSTQIW